MFKDLLKAIIIVVITALITASLYRCNNRGKAKETVIVKDTLTVVKVDTVRSSIPIYIRSETIDTIKIVDTLIFKDTLYLPITQRIYKDSSYTAYVSGYRPSLDSIEVYNKILYRDIITAVASPKARPKRWGIGVHAGYGFGANGLQPYIGVGLSYNVIVF